MLGILKIETLPENARVYFAGSPEVQRVRRSIRKHQRIVATSDPGPLQFTSVPLNVLDIRLIHFKPVGLWYACGAEWLDWLKYNEPTRWGFCGLYEIILDESLLLRIDTLDKLREFARLSKPPQTQCYREHFLNWSFAYSRYAGIEICPYQPKARHEMGWYETWDVASGCVWNSDAIVGVKELLPPVCY